MKTNASKSGLFLMELIMSVLFFSLAASICIQMFVNSHIISRNSVELNHSVEWCQNIAETFYGCNGILSDMNNLFENSYLLETSDSNTDKMILLFDDKFKPIPLSTKLNSDSIASLSFRYYITLTISEKNGLYYCNSEAFQNTSDRGCSISNLTGNSIYKLENILFLEQETTYEQ